MLISKFDLYKTEWLDLVFDDRNKNYGAYELRQHYSRTMVKAMIITFLSIGGAAFILGVIIRPVAAAVAPIVRFTPVLVIPVIPPPVKQPHHTEHSRPVAPAAHAVVSIAHPSIPVVTIDRLVTAPVKLNTAPTDPAPVNINGETGPAGPGPVGPSAGPAASPGDVVTDFHELERMPEPFGGAAAWSKFLTKNIRYPDMAVDQHMSGAVWVSFIVEADGKLSNIKILRGAGYGMDEEALRVLKMAPAWRPGIQNGHSVRVSYNIPIRFVLGDDNN